MLAELSHRPKPPDDLWDEMERTQRAAQKLSRRAAPIPRPPESFRYEPARGLRLRPTHPLNEIHEVAVAPVKTRRRSIQPITPAPKTLVNLVRSAVDNSKRERK